MFTTTDKTDQASIFTNEKGDGLFVRFYFEDAKQKDFVLDENSRRDLLTWIRNGGDFELGALETKDGPAGRIFASLNTEWLFVANLAHIQGREIVLYESDLDKIEKLAVEVEDDFLAERVADAREGIELAKVFCIQRMTELLSDEDAD